ncbi:hypothetical protein OPS25_04720 [Alteromonas ponticola]|uniref:DUF7281 domain-containing protein n=1 Tax=Alteromonas aquimaris TaxID=2998417 RepID=A0ABT3P4V6_9ALTE|nr:hypothetical protein [Alteromonas aquimaris]MCW8107801.1 hypothetical protein [Alteromonas aquimaris]
MVLSKQQQKSLVLFLTGAKLEFTPSLELSAYLRDAYGDLLTWKGKKLRFTPQTKEKFKQIVRLHEPDLLMLPLAGQSRIDFSTVSKFEKKAPITPESEAILITHHQGYFACIGEGVRLPPGNAIRTSYSSLQISKLKTVVVVENLDIFDQWHSANWSQRCEHTIAVYRGHEKSVSKGVKALLTGLPNHVQVIAFCDYDPEGAKIALTLPRLSALLLPTLDEHIVLKFNRIDLWRKQQNAVNFLRARDEANNIEAVKRLVNGHQPLAILQQVILASSLHLYTVNL